VSRPARILVVAHRTAATPKLLEQVRPRARESPCSLVLLVPRPYWDPETEEAAKVIELAVPVLEEAAVGGSRPSWAKPTRSSRFGRRRSTRWIISTLPRRVSHWLRLDLPARVERLGSR
jgi:hypothetical protein